MGVQVNVIETVYAQKGVKSLCIATLQTACEKPEFQNIRVSRGWLTFETYLSTYFQKARLVAAYMRGTKCLKQAILPLHDPPTR